MEDARSSEGDGKDLSKSKRVAMAGQWRTPPNPAFSSHVPRAVPSSSVVPPSSETHATVPSSPAPLPESSEDYAKALQEAYRRGAEAAMAQQQLPTAVSCPNLGSPPVPNPLQQPQQPQQQPQQVSQQSAPPKTSTAARSYSLPEINTYASAQVEEEKRQKRLARNRASARLRRLRKKNLVDAYEAEVGTLEATLAQLEAHDWGNPDHQALLQALSMERGQQAISSEQRATLIQDLLQQQLQHLELLQQAQLEQQLLAAVSKNSDSNAANNDILQELQDVLQLTPSQCHQLQSQSAGLDDEVQALKTVMQSVQTLRDNEWLVNEGVQTWTDPMTSLFHKNQLSKFLLWTDANAEAIDQLDHVSACTPPQVEPVFTFGVDILPGEDDDGK